ncbi:hypothetical protein RB598_009844 [Gaeumannomyces tritici]
MRGRDKFQSFKRPALAVVVCVVALLAGVFLETVSIGQLVAAQEQQHKPQPQTPHIPSENRPSVDARSATGPNPKPQVDVAVVDADAIPPLGGILKTILGGGAPKPAVATAAPPVAALPPVAPAPAAPASGGILGGLVPGLPALPAPLPVLPPVAPVPGSDGSGGLVGAPLPLPAPLPGLPAALPVPAPAAGSAGAGASTGGSRPKLGLLGGLGGLVDDILNPQTGIVAGVIGAVNNILPIPADVAIPIPGVDGILNAASEALQLEDPLKVVTAILDEVGSVVENVGKELNGVVGGVANTVDGVVENLADGALAGLGVPLPDLSILSNITNLVKALPGEILDTVEAVHGSLGALPLDAVLPNAINGVVDALGDTLSGVAQVVDNLVCTVEQIGAVSGILQIPCSQVTFSNSDASLATQGALAVVVTTPVNLLATLTDSAGSALLPTLAAANSLKSMASSAGMALPTNGAALLPSVAAPGSSSAPSAPVAGTPPLAVVSAAAPLSTSLPLPIIPTRPLAPSAPASAVTVTQVVTSCPATISSTPVGCPDPPPCPSCPAAACNCPPELPPFDPALGPCPGQGYTCSSCKDGWFCPPKQVPAQACPCGFGWPCEDCTGGWFCAPVQTSSAQIINVCPASSVPRGSSTSSSAAPSVQPTLALPNGRYAGCYLDTPERALGGFNFTAVPPDHTMTNSICLDFCLEAGFKVAGTENGAECWCDNWLFNTYLIDDSACKTPCTGDGHDSCGGSWALAVYTSDGNVEVRQPEFVLTDPPPGTPETSVHIGGLRQTVIPMTVPVFAWPPPAPSLPVSIDTAALISTVASMVEVVVSKAAAIESDILSRVPAGLAGSASIVDNGLMSLTSDIRSFVSAVATALPVLPTMPGPALPAVTTSGAPAGGGVVVIGNPPIVNNPPSGPVSGGALPGNPQVLPFLGTPFYGRTSKGDVDGSNENPDQPKGGGQESDSSAVDEESAHSSDPVDRPGARRRRLPRRRSESTNADAQP